MPLGKLVDVADENTGNSVIAPEVVIRPILLAPDSANQSAPSGPAAMPAGTGFYERDRGFESGPPEGDGFEPSVPRDEEPTRRGQRPRLSG